MQGNTDGKKQNGTSLENIGHASAKIPVELSTRFLEHFSGQLYSSPQKAFEELISNGWDAGATHVDVRISPNLSDENATMCVLDNGSSMDQEGLRALWHIAFSPKSEQPVQYGRKVIGKFGIGKLATYVLANKLTYICKAADGKIRRVTMDYGDIEKTAGANKDKLISELVLDVYEVSVQEVKSGLQQVYGGDTIWALIEAGIPKPSDKLADDEFGAPKSTLIPPATGTWTLVVLSGLKPTGQELKTGILRRMLEAALPFGSEMAIKLNGDLLVSSKVDEPVAKEWVIGPDLDIKEIGLLIEDSSKEEDQETAAPAGEGSSVPQADEPKFEQLSVISGMSPTPYIELPEIGMITGRVKIFEERISKGKSEEHGSSNGFYVNVLGRVVNQGDPSFGEKNLSHSVWAKFRMTVRADGLNDILRINREQFSENRELKIFRAFLRKVFNKTRSYYDNETGAGMPDGGDVLVRSLGVISLSPLRNVVSATLKTEAPIAGLFDESNIPDREQKRKSWRENTAENIKSALGQVKYEHMDDDSFVKFRISDNSIVINREHPFVAEHFKTKAEKELLRTVAMVYLLSDVYALDMGIASDLLTSIREYRDRLMRFKALERRESGTYIAKLLLQTQHNSDNHKQLEAVVSDALRYIGYQVEEMGQPGEPEGIAKAYSMPTMKTPTVDNPNPSLYSFSFDAKSSKHDAAQTGNIKLDGVVEHRDRYKADYALVVAPGYAGDAITTRCEQQKVTPITARDLGKLLEYTVKWGAIPLTKLRELFSLYDPNEVSTWTNELDGWLKAQRPLTIDIFLKALDNLKGKVPDALPAATLALECRQNLGAVTVQGEDVLVLARGLAILVKDLVGVEGDKIVVNVSAKRLADAVTVQLEQLPSDHATVNDGA